MLADEWVLIITLVFGNLLLLAVKTFVLKSQTPADQLVRHTRAALGAGQEGWEGPAPVAYLLHQRELEHQLQRARGGRTLAFPGLSENKVEDEQAEKMSES